MEPLVVGLVRALLAVGDSPGAVRQASRALTAMTDPGRRGETSWMLVHAQVSAGHSREDDAISTIRLALAAVGLPRLWHARLLAFLALLERGHQQLERRQLKRTPSLFNQLCERGQVIPVWLSRYAIPTPQSPLSYC